MSDDPAKSTVSLLDLIAAAKLRNATPAKPATQSSILKLPTASVGVSRASPAGASSSIIASSLRTTPSISRQIANYSPQVYRNRAFDIAEKLAMTAKLVNHQSCEVMRNLNPSRSPIVEPIDDQIIIRCNQSGLPFASIPAALCDVNAAFEQYYSSPFAMHKNAISYSDFMLVAPEAYITQYLFAFCQQNINNTERLISSLATKQFQRRCNFFDLLFSISPDEEEIPHASPLSNLIGLIFLLHRGGCRKLTASVRDCAEYRSLVNLILQDDYLSASPLLPSHSTEMRDGFIQRIYDLLTAIFSRHLLHYNPLIYQRLSPEFGITITYADFEQVRAMHNTSTIPQITRKQLVEQQKQKQISEAVDFLRKEGFSFTLNKV